MSFQLIQYENQFCNTIPALGFQVELIYSFLQTGHIISLHTMQFPNKILFFRGFFRYMNIDDIAMETLQIGMCNATYREFFENY